MGTNTEKSLAFEYMFNKRIQDAKRLVEPMGYVVRDKQTSTKVTSHSVQKNVAKKSR